MNKNRDVIFLEGVTLFGYVGVLEHEKQDGQNFILDIELETDLSEAGRTDDLRKTVNYAEVYEDAARLMETAQFDLIEAYAEKLSQIILNGYSFVQATRVTVRKPDAPIDGVFRNAGVTIYRERGN